MPDAQVAIRRHIRGCTFRAYSDPWPLWVRAPWGSLMTIGYVERFDATFDV